jgi:ADP-ribose pyrophosphatase YjhB (NUDIX family)
MVDVADLYQQLGAERALFLFGNSFVSTGYPRVHGFELTVEPPWHDFGSDEVLRLKLTSAGIVAFVRNPLGVVLVQVKDEQVHFHWEIPSGEVDLSDWDIEATAGREFLEETGFEIKQSTLVPLTYARRRGADKAGIQFMTIVDIPLADARMDDAGRLLFPPYPGALTAEIETVAIEPFGVFMSPQRSLLQTSRHPWAYVGIRGALEQKLLLLKDI